MRHYYLLAAIPLSFLTGTWLGSTLSEQKQTDAAPGYTLATPQPYTRLDKGDTEQKDSQLPDSLSARMDAFHSELQAMKIALDQLSISIHSYATSRGGSNMVGSISATNYKPNEVAGFQNNIYAQLSDPVFNLNKLQAMPEFQKLSDADKKPVLDEIARRLDSGEINKSTFLPGYSPASK